MSFGYRTFLASLMLIFAVGVSHTFAQEEDPDTIDPVAIFNAAQEAHEKGDLKTAEQLYRKALKAAPEFPEAHFQLGTLLESQKKNDDAEKEYSAASEARPEWTLPLNALGNLMTKTGRLPEAKRFLEKVIELDPDNLPAYGSLARIALRSHASKAELQALLERINAQSAKSKLPAAILLAKSDLESTLGDNASAKRTITALLAADPTNRDAMLSLAAAALNDNDIDTARAIIQKAEAIATDDDLLYLKARAFAAEGRLTEALAALASISRPDAAAADLKARIASTKEVDAAKLEERLKNDPKDFGALSKLCSVYRVSAPEKALEFCRQAAELDPKDLGHAVGYGAALVQAKRFADAAVILEKLKALAPDNATVHANLGASYLQLKRLQEAKNEYNWLIDKNVGLPIAYFFVGVICDQLGEYPDAMANYQLFLKGATDEKFKLEVDKVNLRLPILQRQLKGYKPKKQ